MKSFVAGALALAGAASAQQSAWGQCGGQGWTGQTTCVAGSTCVVQNPWYSQCLPGEHRRSSSGQPDDDVDSGRDDLDTGHDDSRHIDDARHASPGHDDGGGAPHHRRRLRQDQRPALQH
ncbi:hypothetical protein HYQ45_010486 [Verticillium longisporum]|uniref:CBM1 domain-containing protein n=1 Tax=Verticillium longisporum TaxID=100787 RepID=A0A8I2ZIP3_VERLO|nr:hypothetical protein HYQ45_010486 [Verticillium longisporum]